MTLRVAIVGAGPAGFYAAEGLNKAQPGCAIDLIDRLPTPYGLVRFGVAPDHEGTRRITRVFDRVVSKGDVRFLGNVELGRDISLDELRGFYDAVILAQGCPVDRQLGIPGEDLSGVIGSAALVGWYNGHPDHTGLAPDFCHRSAVVIGNGNVAIDVARILCRVESELAGTDMPGYARRALAASAIREIHVCGRRGPMEAAFAENELAEIGRLDGAVAVADANQLPNETSADPAKQRILDTLKGYAANQSDPDRRTIGLRFFARPVAILGDDRVTAVRFERTKLEDGQVVGSGETFDVPAGLVVPCIGYRARPLAGMPYDDARGVVPNHDGRVEPGLYVVGWAKRGPSGVIADNRADSHAVARLIAEDMGAGGDKPGGTALDAVLMERNLRPVGYADWQRINDAETAAATDGAPRRKFTDLAEMLAVLEGNP